MHRQRILKFLTSRIVFCLTVTILSHENKSYLDPMVLQNGKPILSLQQFILKQEVKNLYREIFKTVRLVPGESHQNELKEWARRDFRANSHITDELTIRMHINYGKRCLKELQNSLAFSGYN